MEALLPKHTRLVSLTLADLFMFEPEICGHATDMLPSAVFVNKTYTGCYL